MDNNRRNRRVRVNFHMRLRGKDVHGKDFEEVVKTVDISKTGACFITDKDLPVGAEVFLAIPLPATVVRIDKYEKSADKKYGVFFRPYHPEPTEKK